MRYVSILGVYWKGGEERKVKVGLVPTVLAPNANYGEFAVLKGPASLGESKENSELE